MARGVFRRIDGHAVPAGKEAREALFAIPNGGLFMADFRTARNPEQHNLFFALCDLVAEATDTYKDDVKEWLLIKAGFGELRFYPDGSMGIKAKSIAFKPEAMEQTEFNDFFRAAVEQIAELLGSSPKEVWDRFNDLLDPNVRADTRMRLQVKASPSLAPADAVEERSEAIP